MLNAYGSRNLFDRWCKILYEKPSRNFVKKFDILVKLNFHRVHLCLLPQPVQVKQKQNGELFFFG
jgi:hypothetical protein